MSGQEPCVADLQYALDVLLANLCCGLSRCSSSCGYRDSGHTQSAAASRVRYSTEAAQVRMPGMSHAHRALLGICAGRAQETPSAATGAYMHRRGRFVVAPLWRRWRRWLRWSSASSTGTARRSGARQFKGCVLSARSC